ncbi:hypothetical protein ACLKA6_016330 [Drosophila palustris]
MPLEKRNIHGPRESLRPYPYLTNEPKTLEEQLRNRVVYLRGYSRNCRKQASSIRLPAGKSRLSIINAYLRDSQNSENQTSFQEHCLNLTKLTSID